MVSSISASNSVYMLGIVGLFPVPQKLQGYSADAAFDTDASEIAEVMKGVDGKMSAGYVPYITRQTVSLQADSPSAFLFDEWIAAMKLAKEIYTCFALIKLPSIGRAFTLTGGVLTSGPAIPGTRKVLQPRNFIISWDDISPAPML